MAKRPKYKQRNGGMSIDSLASSRPVGQVFTSGGKYYQSYPDPASPTGYTLKTWSDTEPESFAPINEPYSVSEQKDREDATRVASETGRETMRLNDSLIKQRAAQIKYDDARLRQEGRIAEADRKLKRELAQMDNDLHWAQLGKGMIDTGASLSGPADPFSFSDAAQGYQSSGLLPKAFERLSKNQYTPVNGQFGAQPAPLNLGSLMARLSGQPYAATVAPGTLPGQASAGGQVNNAAGGISDQDRINASYGALLPVAMNPNGVSGQAWSSLDMNDQKAALNGIGKLGFAPDQWLRMLTRSHPTQGSVLAA